MFESTGSSTAPAWLDYLLRLLITLGAFLLAFMIRRGWQRCFREYDRSMLIRIGVGEDSLDFENAPIIVGQFPFSELGDRVRSNLDPRNVVGFVIGKPKWMEIDDLKQLRIVLDKEYLKPGYYAYSVIQWEHADMVKRFNDQWFHIRRTRYNGNRREFRMREDRFISFGTDSEPDPGTDNVRPVVAHFKTGLLASFQYQPYLKGGFKPEDIKMRSLAPQTKGLILLKDLFTKEWRNA